LHALIIWVCTWKDICDMFPCFESFWSELLHAPEIRIFLNIKRDLRSRMFVMMFRGNLSLNTAHMNCSPQAFTFFFTFRSYEYNLFTTFIRIQLCVSFL
jgi:hypothetical protein